jgi:adenosine deaminase
MVDPNIPLIDLHRHLDGNVRLETVLELGEKHSIPLPAWDTESLRPHIQVTEPQIGVMAFIAKFKWFTAVMADLEACRRIAYENVEDAYGEGIDYVELRFSPWFMAEDHGLPVEGVVDAVVDGVAAGRRDFDIKVKLIGIISRTYGTEVGWKELNALLLQRDKLVAIDLAGDEVNFPPDLFETHFQKVRDAGLQVTIHAGESTGPESIWDAIRLLGAMRIGHALAASEDDELMDFMQQNRVAIETNLTSNVQTSGVPDYASHPLKSYLERGILATINTDDPGISNINLREEYEIAAPAAGLSPELIRQAQRNALEAAFLTEEERQKLLNRKR